MALHFRCHRHPQHSFQAAGTVCPQVSMVDPEASIGVRFRCWLGSSRRLEASLMSTLSAVARGSWHGAGTSTLTSPTDAMPSTSMGVGPSLPASLPHR
eukprot:413008-Rhodomonas_salina.2